MSQPQPRTLLSIQYLRGLAALAVVVVHTTWLPFHAGYAGVDVFFVISGFIMVHVSGREAAPAAFLLARAIRVLPLYWLMVLLTAVESTDNSPPRVLAALALWPTQRFDGQWLPVLTPGWTLSYEAFFYLAFAAALLLPASRRLAALTGGLLMIVAAVLAGPRPMFEGVTPLLLPEFLAGAWLCRAWQAGRLPGAVAGCLMALSGAAAILLLPAGSDLPWRPVLWGIPALLAVAGLLTLETRGRLPQVPGLLALGNASYALYLTHPMMFWAVRAPLKHLPGVLALPLLLAACIAVALLVHRYTEQPMTRWLKGRLAVPRTGVQRGAA